MLPWLSVFVSGNDHDKICNYLCLQIGKYDRQFWEQSVEQEVLKVKANRIINYDCHHCL